MVSAVDQVLEAAARALAGPEAELVEREKVLGKQLDQVQWELSEVRRALGRLRALRGPGEGAASPSSTFKSPSLDALEKYLETLPPGARVRGGEAAAWALANGWSTGAVDPAAAMRSVLSRVAEQGLVRSEGHGRHFKWDAR